jgi:hypothetical protein
MVLFGTKDNNFIISYYIKMESIIKVAGWIVLKMVMVFKCIQMVVFLQEVLNLEKNMILEEFNVRMDVYF